MQTRVQKGIAVLAAMLLSACGADQMTSGAEIAAPRFQTTTPPPSVRFSEIHYDNDGTDADEKIEVSLPTGLSVVDFSVVLYNGSNGQSYTTSLLSSGERSTCAGGTRDVIVLSYPVNGIQNGAPDGMALVDAAGSVIEFLSYEGTFVATNGPALNVGSTDIGVSQPSTTARGLSLQRMADGTWASNATSTFGACNDGQSGGPTIGPVETVTIDPAVASLTITQSTSLVARGVDAAGQTVTGTTFTWSAVNEAIATVNASGTVTAVSLGSTEIRATSPNGKVGTATITVIPAPSLPTVRISEIHYDNSGADVGEAVEIEAPAGQNLDGWSIVLYNGNGAVDYGTRTLTGMVPNSCGGRGVLVFEYPQNGLQNGGTNATEPDGLALVNAEGVVVEFLSYEGTMTATRGPANGLTSRDIIARQDPPPAIGLTLQRSLADTWTLATDNFGGCNGRTSGVRISFSGRLATEPPLPVGFQDQLFANVRRGGEPVEETVTWSSVTPELATIDTRGVITARAEGAATFRATLSDGFTADYTLPTVVALPWAAPTYEGNEAFGRPFDGNLSDEVIIERMGFTTSFSRVRGIPNWVSYNLEQPHIGANDRCDCFTFDPELVGAGLSGYTTADYTGAGDVAGYGIDRGHLVRSFDRTAGALDNAQTFYFSNIVPQASDNNQGPWAALETFLGNMARLENKEVYIIAGASGSRGTVKNEGKITIPEYMWKVAVILPRDRGLADFSSPDAGEVIAVVMPNEPGIRSVPWTSYKVTVDSVEALSKYNLLDLLPDQIEIAVESNTKAPDAKINGPFTILAGETVALSAAGSTDADGDALSYAWAFGDGSTGVGQDVTNRYTVPGIYTATVTVTDIRALFAQASTTVTVLSSAAGLSEAAAMIEELGTTAKLNRGLANSLAVKARNAGASLTRGSAESARGQLGALVNELDALARSGRITSANAEPVRAYLLRVIASLQFGV